jgi:hypothetical protein
VTYKVSAPIMTFYPGGRELDLERALHELRRTRSERVFLIAPSIYNLENLAAKMPRLSVCLDFFAKAGLEPARQPGKCTLPAGRGVQARRLRWRARDRPRRCQDDSDRR